MEKEMQLLTDELGNAKGGAGLLPGSGDLENHQQFQTEWSLPFSNRTVICPNGGCTINVSPPPRRHPGSPGAPHRSPGVHRKSR